MLRKVDKQGVIKFAAFEQKGRRGVTLERAVSSEYEQPLFLNRGLLFIGALGNGLPGVGGQVSSGVYWVGGNRNRRHQIGDDGDKGNLGNPSIGVLNE